MPLHFLHNNVRIRKYQANKYVRFDNVSREWFLIILRHCLLFVGCCECSLRVGIHTKKLSSFQGRDAFEFSCCTAVSRHLLSEIRALFRIVYIRCSFENKFNKLNFFNLEKIMRDAREVCTTCTHARLMPSKEGSYTHAGTVVYLLMLPLPACENKPRFWKSCRVCSLLIFLQLAVQVAFNTAVRFNLFRLAIHFNSLSWVRCFVLHLEYDTETASERDSWPVTCQFRFALDC